MHARPTPAARPAAATAATPRLEPPRPAEVGLPAAVRACLFDLDGVLTRTALVHAAAWAEMFDDFLRRRAAAQGATFVPFDPVADYDAYVDGKPRADGVRDFLAARGITLPEGTDDDPPGASTVHGLGNRKNVLLLERIRTDGVQVYEGSIRYLRRARAAGLLTAVVSSSANTRQVLQVTGIEGLFDARVDAGVVRERGLRGKPAPDGFLAAASDLGVRADQAAVFEDALAGVEAGRAGGFAVVVGVDRAGSADPGHAGVMRAHGADQVVTDLSDLLPDPSDPPPDPPQGPSATATDRSGPGRNPGPGQTERSGR